MKITYTKVSPETCKRNRTFYKNHVRKAFVMWCAYEGCFDGVFTPTEIKKAQKGVLPDDCNIHHKIPLSGSGDNDIVNGFANLTVLHKKTHERLNKHVFAPQLAPITLAPFGTSIEIDVPAFGYVDHEGILQERAMAKMQFRNKGKGGRK